MRLSKKIAAVALAAVMAVSMLTACGGTDAPSSSSPSSSSSSSSSGADSSSSSSSSGSASDSSSSSSGFGSSSNSGTEDKEENIAYKNSRTARFYQKLGTSYTLGMKLDVTVNDERGTADMLADILTVTNGGRSYQQDTIQSNGDAESQTQTMLVDKTKQKIWTLIPKEDDDTKEQGKLGYCYSATISGTSTGGDVLGNVMPNESLKFKQETKGNYYIESQSFAVLTDEGLAEYAIAYYFEGNDSAPKYVDVKESFGSKETITIRMTFTRIEYKADAKYLDFETILKQYIDITDQIPQSTAQAMNPSIAGLNIG